VKHGKRGILPILSQKSSMTANIREWQHFFKLRCASAVHFQMREVADILFREMSETYPVFFEDMEMKIK